MDPNKLPANTEYSYAHYFQPHPYLGGGFSIAPINPQGGTNATMTLSELESRKGDENIRRAAPPRPNKPADLRARR